MNMNKNGDSIIGQLFNGDHELIRLTKNLLRRKTEALKQSSKEDLLDEILDYEKSTMRKLVEKDDQAPIL